jgi:hypothetical protein
MMTTAALDLDVDDLKYVPAGYQPIFLENAVLWGGNRSGSLAAALVPEGTRSIERLLAYRLSRTLHIVVYDSNEEACRALGRRVAPTALLAPLHTRRLALVALQAPSVDRRNGDMRLASWVNEGFAENVAASVAMRPDVIHAALERCSALEMSDHQLATAFEDLNSVDREVAFAAATVRVWRALQVHGFMSVFENLSHPDTWACG